MLPATVRLPAALLVLLPALGHAYPFLAPRPIPTAIAGPTDPHVAATYYNPAALGPLRGLHLHVEGGARAHLGAIDRDPVEGRDPGQTPIAWANPDGFAGLSWDLSTDSFTIGLAVHAPYTDLTRYDFNAPVRYHATEHSMIVLQETLAAALRLSSRFYVGAATQFAQVWLQHRYARDAAIYGGTPGVDEPGGLCGGMACGLENPLAEQRLRLRGANPGGIGFSVGILARPVDRLWLGLSYISHVFNTGTGGDLPLEDHRRARVTAAPGQGPVCGDPNTCWANNLITVAVPDIIYLGARVEINTRLDLEMQARWVHYGTRDQLDVSLQGGNLHQLSSGTGTNPGPRFLLDRGFRDTLTVGLSTRHRVGERLRLSPSLFFETAAVDPATVNAASIDGNKLDAALTLEWHPLPRLLIGAHLGGTAYILSSAGHRFDPRAQVRCTDSGYALEACTETNFGHALPRAAGAYTMFVLHAGLAVGFDY